MTDKMPNVILLSGHARFPNECPAKSVYEFLSIVAEVETEEWTIISLDVTMITDTAKRFIKNRLLGKRMIKDGESIIKEFEMCYYGGAKKALIAALLDLNIKMKDISNKIKKT
jgi:hypothetical protein